MGLIRESELYDPKLIPLFRAMERGPLAHRFTNARETLMQIAMDGHSEFTLAVMKSLTAIARSRSWFLISRVATEATRLVSVKREQMLWANRCEVIADFESPALGEAWLNFSGVLARKGFDTVLNRSARLVKGFEAEASSVETCEILRVLPSFFNRLDEDQLLEILSMLSRRPSSRLFREAGAIMHATIREATVEERANECPERLLLAIRFAATRRLRGDERLADECDPEVGAARALGVADAILKNERADDSLDSRSWIEVLAQYSRARGWEALCGLIESNQRRRSGMAREWERPETPLVAGLDVAGMALNYVRALSSDSKVNVRVIDDPQGSRFATDGETIFIPRSIAVYGSREENYRNLIDGLAHESAHIEFGTFRPDRLRLAALVRRYRIRYRRERAMDRSRIREYQREFRRRMEQAGRTVFGLGRRKIVRTMRSLVCFHTAFPNPLLIKGLHNTIEDCRVDQMRIERYPGHREIFSDENRGVWGRRPNLDTMAPVAATIEAILQLAYWNRTSGTIPKAAEAVVVHARKKIRQMVENTESNVTDSLALSGIVYDNLVRVFGEEVHRYDYVIVPVGAGSALDGGIIDTIRGAGENRSASFDLGSLTVIPRGIQPTDTGDTREIRCSEGRIDCWNQIETATGAMTRRLKREFAALRPDVRAIQKRQRSGPEIDMNHLIREFGELAAGQSTEFRVFSRRVRARRDVALAVIIDVSGSVAEPLGSGTVLDVEKNALAVLAECASACGDRLLIYGFDERWGCKDWYTQMHRVMGPGDAWDRGAKLRLAGMEAGGGTLAAPAIRKAASILNETRAETQLLAVVTDGQLEGRDDVLAACRRAVSRGVRIAPVVVGPAAADGTAERYFPRGYIGIDSARELGDALLKLYRGRLF